MMAEQRANDPADELLEDAGPPVADPEPEPFTEAQGDAIAYVIVELRKQWREERDEAIAPLKAEIAELKGKLDACLPSSGRGSSRAPTWLTCQIGGSMKPHNGRRVDLARSWQFARMQYAAVVAELAEVKRERDEFRAALAELRAAVTARWEAEARLAELYRERASARARAVERHPASLLN
jgi:ribosomal protein L29